MIGEVQLLVSVVRLGVRAWDARSQGVRFGFAMLAVACGLACAVALTYGSAVARADDPPPPTTTTTEPAPDPVPDPAPAPTPKPPPKAAPKSLPRPAPAPRRALTVTAVTPVAPSRPTRVVRSQPRPQLKPPAKTRTQKRIVRIKPKKHVKSVGRNVIPQPKPVVKRQVSHVLGATRTAAAGDPQSHSLIVMTMLALAIACFGAGAVPAAAIRRRSLVYVIGERHARLTALGVAFLAAAGLAFLLAGGK